MSGTVLGIKKSAVNKAPVQVIDQLVKDSPAMQETPVRFLGRVDPMEEG